MVVEAVETGFDVTFHEPHRTLKVDVNVFQCRVTAPSGSESVGVLGKVGLVNAFEYHSDNLLYQLVLCGLYPQRAFFVAVFLGDVGAPCRIRLVAVVFERGNDFLNTLRAHAVDGLSVHTLGHVALPCADVVIGKVIELGVIQISVQSLKTV